MIARRGYLLAEALCALALAGLLAVAAAAALTTARRAMAVAEGRARAERAGREAIQVVAALVRTADSVEVLGDTALELSIRIASAVVCGRDGAALVLPPARVTSGLPFTNRAQPIEAGDAAEVLELDTLLGSARWARSRVDSASERSALSVCGPADGFVDAADAGASRIRLVLADSAVRAAPGAAVRIGRRGRIAIYYAGAGEWMLGWRRCGQGTCGVIQPVAGPLRSAASGGFRVRTDGVGFAVSVRVPGVPDAFESLLGRADVAP
jgi:type II secretory pathway pseudopilin PulG